jgi:hypothetical protein
MRRIAERLYFHRRNDAGIDREAYLRWMEQDGYPKAVASRGDAR